MSKRKHSSLKMDTADDSGSLTAQVRQWEANVQSSQQNLNDIVEIFGVAKSADPEASFVAINSLGKIYGALWTKGLMSPVGDASQDPAAAKVSAWLQNNYSQYTSHLLGLLRHSEAALQVAALKLLMQMLEKESMAGSAKKPYEFPNASFTKLIDAVLSNDAASEHLLRVLADSFLNMYDDLRLHFHRSVAKIGASKYDRNTKIGRMAVEGSAEAASMQVFVRNTFTMLSSIRVMPKKAVAELDSFWIPVTEDAADAKSPVTDPKAYRRAHSDAWLLLMRLPLTVEIFKQILLTIHRRIIPYMPDPRSLMDFLTHAYDAGGSISLLALNGLFTLITDHNLNYPMFYEKLYALLDRNLFHVKYRARFFRLFDIFLRSSHLPAYLIAAFIKRISRLALSAPPSGAVIVIPVVYNLLKAHPRCMVLIHRMPGYDEETGEETVLSSNDPYLPDEPDLAKCMAMQSSLWELETLQHHFYGNISTLARIFSEPFHKPAFVLEDFLDHTYTTFFESDTAKKLKKPAALSTQPPTTLLRAGDALSDFLAF
ncbi:Maturation and nuclear export of 40S ribosomal subunits interacting protein [Coemansia sp. Benny D115]|nr:Maturation and nuclear export of 40S ribosomal subunits interacting protein [Coemansia sp. Benny D115]